MLTRSLALVLLGASLGASCASVPPREVTAPVGLATPSATTSAPVVEVPPEVTNLAAPAVSASARPVLGVDEALAAVTEERVRAHVAWLASDDLEGRNVGTPGLARAATYLEEHLGNVLPAGDVIPPGKTRGYEQRFDVERMPTSNVLGMIEGTDLGDEVIVLGAHFDHLGSLRQPHPGRTGSGTGDDSIWNGADDNASGTAAVLAAAEALGAGNVRCRRTLLFAFFSGEEWGLLGSRWYTAHPLVPMEHHRLMLNLDMVGRNPALSLAVQGHGASLGTLRAQVATAARQSALKVNVIDLKTVRQDSDHAPFFSSGVPFLFFYSGDHHDYHQVTDHTDRIAFDRLAHVARTAARVALAACNDPPARRP